MVTIELMDIISKVKETGVLGWIKINDASKIVSNSNGTYSINTTIYMQNFVQKEEGDEIVMFGKKQLNITKLEKDLRKYIGLEVNIYVGGVSFCGKLINTTIESIKKDLGINQKDIAKFFDMSYMAFANSTAKERYENSLCKFYKFIKNKEINN